jgi:molybdopterin-binding protein
MMRLSARNQVPARVVAVTKASDVIVAVPG